MSRFCSLYTSFAFAVAYVVSYGRACFWLLHAFRLLSCTCCISLAFAFFCSMRAFVFVSSPGPSGSRFLRDPAQAETRKVRVTGDVEHAARCCSTNNCVIGGICTVICVICTVIYVTCTEICMICRTICVICTVTVVICAVLCVICTAICVICTLLVVTYAVSVVICTVV